MSENTVKVHLMFPDGTVHDEVIEKQTNMTMGELVTATLKQAGVEDEMTVSKFFKQQTMEKTFQMLCENVKEALETSKEFEEDIVVRSGDDAMEIFTLSFKKRRVE